MSKMPMDIGGEKTYYRIGSGRIIMSRIAIITARGGSKRIPQKNIKEFCGKPIIAYSIDAALSSGEFDEVMVSTDSQEIARIAKDYGANVPFFRSPMTSNDFATTADVLCEVISEYEKMGRYFDVLCCIYPTAPFLTAQKLKFALKEFEKSGVDSLVPIVQFSFPPQRAMIIKEGKLVYQYPEFTKSRSQDLEVLYHDCGQFYICQVKSFKYFKSIVTPNSLPFIMQEEEVQDIDNLSDWILAEAKYKAFILKGGEK